MSTTTKAPERLRREVSEIWQDLKDDGPERGPIGQVCDLFEADTRDVGAARHVTQEVLETLAERLLPPLIAALGDPSEEGFERFIGAFKDNTEYAVDISFLLGVAVGREHQRRGYRLDA